MNKEYINLHINANRFTHGSRVLKETSSLVNAKLVEKILIVALGLLKMVYYDRDELATYCNKNETMLLTRRKQIL